jgi:hypothetical protein
MNFLRQERETLEKLLLGPAAFMQAPEVSYIHAATAVLTLHPPARLGACKRLDAYLAGSPLVLD